MKTTAQVQTKRNTKQKPPQLQGRRTAGPKSAERIDSELFVALSHILSEGEIVSLATCIQNSKLTVLEYVHKAICEKMLTSGSSLVGKWTDLEQSINQTAALLQILSDQLESRHLSASEFDQEAQWLFMDGVSNLVEQANAKLRADFNAVFFGSSGKVN